MSRFLARRPPPTPSERWAAARAGEYRAVAGAGNAVPFSADATRASGQGEEIIIPMGNSDRVAHTHVHDHDSGYDTHGQGGWHGHLHTHLDGTSHAHPHIHDHDHHDLHDHDGDLHAHPEQLARAGDRAGETLHEHSHTHLHSHTHTFRAGQPTDSRLVSAEELRAPFGLKADALAQGKKPLAGVHDTGQLNTYQVPPPSPAMTVTGQTVGHQALFNTEDANALQFGAPPAAGQTLDIAKSPSDDVTLDPADFHEYAVQGSGAAATEGTTHTRDRSREPMSNPLMPTPTPNSGGFTDQNARPTPKNSGPQPSGHNTGIVLTSAIARPPAPRGPVHAPTAEQTPAVAQSWSRPTAALTNVAKDHDNYGGDLDPSAHPGLPLDAPTPQQIRAINTHFKQSGCLQCRAYLMGVRAGIAEQWRRAATPTQNESSQTARLPYELAVRQNKVVGYRRRFARDEQVQRAGAIAAATVGPWNRDGHEPITAYLARVAKARGTAEAAVLTGR